MKMFQLSAKKSYNQLQSGGL